MSAFHDRGVSGSFVVLDAATGERFVLGGEDAARATIPCSTFKIPNTLIGLETGVITGEDFTLPWDGQKREFEAWNHDHDVRSALRDSVVWFYQEVARRIGPERMKKWVFDLRYGNRAVEGPIDAFWLDDGSLRLSPEEQVEFLRRVRAYQIPVRRENVDLLMRILPSERVGDAVVRAKTGIGRQDGRTVGWLVGYVERAGRTWIFALRVDAPGAELTRVMPLRREIAYELLARYGAVPAIVR